MTSLFADSYNMISVLEKSEAAAGFEQIIDFLSGSYIQHALTVNPHVYISCIKQFWITAVVKRSGDVTSSAMASALICLSTGQKFNFSKYIFKSLVRNFDSTSKFYMYPRFIQLIIQSTIADLSKHTDRYISPMLTQKVFANMRRVGKGFSGVETPLFANMLEVRTVEAEEEVQIPAQDDVVLENVTEQVAATAGTSHIADDVAQPTSPLPPSPIIPSTPPHQSTSPPQPQPTEGSSHLVQQVLDKCSALVLRVEGLETANVAQQLEFIRLKARVKKLERLHKGRISVDVDEGIELEEDTKVQEVVEVVNAAKLITEVVTAAATQVAAVSAPVPATKPKVLKIAAAPTVSIRKRKGVIIRDPKEELDKDTPAETLFVKDKGKGILIKDPKLMKKKDQIAMDAEYHGFKKKPQSESEACKNMISYLKNTEGFKMEYFKGKTYDQILPIFQARLDANLKFLFKSRVEMEKEDEEIIKSINETPAQKALKRRRLREQAKEDEDLKKQLEIVVDEDDDVFIKATPIGRKVLVVNYEIVMINNKPRCDNGTEFKNADLNQFCGLKGIRREFNVPRTPQENGIAERKNRTLIEAARTLLADLLLPIPFWAKAVNTACYVPNRVLVTKPHNKTPYELLHGRLPSIGFMRPFGCPVTILNTLDPLGKFQGKVDEGFLVGYSVCSKAFRVFDSRTRIIQETLHVNFRENKPNVTGSGPAWLFDIDSLSQTMNYHPVLVENQINSHAGEEGTQTYVLFPVLSDGSTNPKNNKDAHTAKEQGDKAENKDKGKSLAVTITVFRDLNEEFT
nr:retrovirus-related Pol polyprotein from transposon TNT 1-94 [Tanacetum cinerariifolium]